MYSTEYGPNPINTPDEIVKKRQEKQKKEKEKRQEKSPVEGKDSVDMTSFKQSMQKAGASSLGSGNASGDVGSMLMMTGNPKAMAAGAALKVMGAVRAKREKIAEQRAQQENERRARLEKLMSQLGTGVGSMGMA